MYGENQLYECIKEGIIIINKAFGVLYCNNSIIQHFAVNLQGRNLAEVLGEEEIKKLANIPLDKEFNLIFISEPTKSIPTECRLLEGDSGDGQTRVLVIQKYLQECFDWKEIKVLLDKLPYLVWVEDYKRNYIYMNDMGKWLLKLVSGVEKLDDDLLNCEGVQIWKGYIPKHIWESDNKILAEKGSLYAERFLEYKGKEHKYCLSKWAIHNSENKIEKVVTIGKLDLYTKKQLAINDSNAKEEKALPYLAGVSKVNTQFASDMIGARHIHICCYDEAKHKLEIMKEIEEKVDERELFGDAYMSYDTYTSFVNKEEALSVQELEEALGCSPLKRWYEQNIILIHKYPIYFGSECLGVLLISFSHYAEDNFKQRQLLNKLIEDVAFIIKNVQLNQRVKSEFLRRQIVENELRECLNIAIDASFIFDKNGTIIKMGRAAESILGWKQKEAIGHNIRELTNSEVMQEMLANGDEIKAANDVVQGMQQIKDKKGKMKWLEWRGKYSKDKEAIFVVIRDVTLAREKEAERMAYKEALQMETLKNEFIANISHELKTPLNNIYSMVQLVELETSEFRKMCKENGINVEKLERYRRLSKQNIYRLLRMINNITDASEMDADTYKLKFENYNVVNVVEELIYSIAEHVQKRELEITVDTMKEEIIMATDINKFEKIIFNLLSNSVKYTPMGGRITVSLQTMNDQLVIEVKDNGIGIPLDKQEIIFDKFTQVDNIYTRRCEGTGLGLALTKKIVTLLGGNISVESQEGKGACFRVKLPIQRIEGGPIIHYDEKEKRVLNCNIQFSDIYDL